MLQKQGRLNEARDRYRQALAIGLPPGRTAQVRTRLGLVHERLGISRGARAAHDAAVAERGRLRAPTTSADCSVCAGGTGRGRSPTSRRPCDATRRGPIHGARWPGLGVAQPGASGARRRRAAGAAAAEEDSAPQHHATVARVDHDRPLLEDVRPMNPAARRHRGDSAGKGPSRKDLFARATLQAQPNPATDAIP